MDLTIDSGVAALVGAFIGGLVSFGTTWQNNRAQNRLSRLNCERQLRDDKRARIRASLKALTGLLDAMHDIMIEQKIVKEGETVEARDVKLDQLLATHAARASDALTELSLDIEADQLVSAFYDARNSFQRFQNGRAAHRNDPESVRYPKEDESEFGQHASRFRNLVREQLAALDRPE